MVTKSIGKTVKCSFCGETTATRTVHGFPHYGRSCCANCKKRLERKEEIAKLDEHERELRRDLADLQFKQDVLSHEIMLIWAKRDALEATDGSVG